MSKQKPPSDWRVLTRKDIPHFDDYATSAVLWAMDHGGVGRISSNGHALLRAPNGDTMAVTRNSFKSKQIVGIKLRRMFPDTPDEVPDVPDPAEKVETPSEPEPPILRPTLECSVKGCEAVFVTEGARYSHIHDKHHVCKFPGCMFASDRTQSVAAHYRIVHEGIAPRRVGEERKRERATAKPKQTPEFVMRPVKPQETPVSNPSRVRVSRAQPVATPQPAVPERAVMGDFPKQVQLVMLDIATALARMDSRLDDRIAKLEQENQELRERLDKLRDLLATGSRM